MPDVLVTGASGFIAGHCVAELASHGYEVRGTVRDPARAAHLEGLAELVTADLESDEGWAEAVAGCEYVLHVASPFPLEDPADEDELIRPAVQGTLRVLRACAASGTVRRVVLTSSVAAVAPHHPGPEPLTEADWADADSDDPYQKSKTLAERAAWDFVRAQPGPELVVINPGLVLGPVQHAVAGTSLEPIRRLLARDVPGVPRLGWAIVDVRDVAAAHRLAMEHPAAAGHRYICAGPHVWMGDMAAILTTRYRVPTRPAPYWLLWIAGRFDAEIRGVLGAIGHRELVSADKARRELGWTMRPLEDTILDTAASLIDYRCVKPMAGTRQRNTGGRARVSRPGALGPQGASRPGVSAAAADDRDRHLASGPAWAARFPGRYLSLATSRRDGTAVATPVWFAEDGGSLLVWTSEQSGKVKRIRRNPSVTVAPCTATGRLRGQRVPARARLLPAGEAARAKGLLARKYRYDMALLRALEAVLALARRRTVTVQVYLEITPC